MIKFKQKNKQHHRKFLVRPILIRKNIKVASKTAADKKMKRSKNKNKIWLKVHSLDKNSFLLMSLKATTKQSTNSAIGGLYFRVSN